MRNGRNKWQWWASDQSLKINSDLLWRLHKEELDSFAVLAGHLNGAGDPVGRQTRLPAADILPSSQLAVMHDDTAQKEEETPKIINGFCCNCLFPLWRIFGGLCYQKIARIKPRPGSTHHNSMVVANWFFSLQVTGLIKTKCCCVILPFMDSLRNVQWITNSLGRC